jgi:hypothetical protein
MCVCTQDRTRYCGGSTHKHSIHTALLDHHRRAECNRRPCSMRVVRLKATYFSLNAQESHAHPPAFPFFLVTSCSSPSQQALPCTPTQKEISQTLHLGERAHTFCLAARTQVSPRGRSQQSALGRNRGQQSLVLRRGIVPRAHPVPTHTTKWTHARTHDLVSWGRGSITNRTTNGTTPSLLHSRCFLGIHLPSRGSCRQRRSRFSRCLCDASLV